MPNNRITELESILGYEFKDIALLETALTHSSYSSEHDRGNRFNNERLEFIGDGYLDAIIGMELYGILTDASEGVLSKTRANVVCEKSLASISRKLNVGDYLMLGRGEAENGGRNKDSILADAMEAIIGAIISDGCYEDGREFVLRVMRENIELAIEGKLIRDYKSELQEILQKKYRGIRINYSLIREEGPDHCKEFTVQVSIHDRVLGTGTGHSKKEAEQHAACDVILKGEF